MMSFPMRILHGPSCERGYWRNGHRSFCTSSLFPNCAQYQQKAQYRNVGQKCHSIRSQRGKSRSVRFRVGYHLQSLFTVFQICLVGSNRYNTFGSHGASDFIAFKHFSTLRDCCTYLIEQHSNRRRFEVLKYGFNNRL